MNSQTTVSIINYKSPFVLFPGIVTAARILGAYIELIEKDHFMKPYLT
jgi:hypothetical protein